MPPHSPRLSTAFRNRLVDYHLDLPDLGPVGFCLASEDYTGRPPPEGHLNNKGLNLNYLLAGAGTLRDWQGQEHTLEPGCIFLRSGRKSHVTRFQETPPCREYFLSMNWKLTDKLEELQLIDWSTSVYRLGLRPDLVEAWERLIEIVDHHSRPPGCILGSIIGLIASLTAGTSSDEETGYGPGDVERWLPEARRLLSTRLQQPVSPEDVARQINLSYPTFRAYFQRIEGISPLQYRINRKIEMAKMLLQDHPVKVVADRLGYPDIFSFSRQFKKATGQTPKSFRIS